MTHYLSDEDHVSPPESLAIRHDGWTYPRQRAFLERLSETGVVRHACDAAEMSPRSAYNLRGRADGVGFRLGWDAAILIARGRLVDELMARALEGQTEVRSRDRDYDTITRHRHDNRLAMAMLSRLDRIAEVDLTAGTNAVLSRIVSQDFEAFLDLIEAGGGAAETALFVAVRRPLDPANRQCELCHNAAGKTEAEDKEEDCNTEEYMATYRQKSVASRVARLKVWYNAYDDKMRTNFPPPPGFPNNDDPVRSHYYRALTEAELDAYLWKLDEEDAPYMAAAETARDAYFGFVPPAAKDGEVAEAGADEMV